MRTLTYVTSNEIKFKVAMQALKGSGIMLVQEQLLTPEIQSSSVEEIAGWSATWASQRLNKPVVVMDAGFYIEALNGFPGPFIRYINEWFSVQDYLNLMQGKVNRRVSALDCLAYGHPGEKPMTFCQVHTGKLALEPGQQTGTSIDQLFIPEGYTIPISDIPVDEMVTYWSHTTVWEALRLSLEDMDFPNQTNNLS